MLRRRRKLILVSCTIGALIAPAAGAAPSTDDPVLQPHLTQSVR
jgi:hypothetical protein